MTATPVERSRPAQRQAAIAEYVVGHGSVSATELAEAIAGLILIALLTRPAELNDIWVERTTTLLLKGISA